MTRLEEIRNRYRAGRNLEVNPTTVYVMSIDIQWLIDRLEECEKYIQEWADCEFDDAKELLKKLEGE